jgi:two-component system OmpR family sensor kinase
MLTALPIRLRLAAAFALAMAAILVALGLLVYQRVGSALLHSVDQGLRAQAVESAPHARKGALIDVDARDSRTVAQILAPDGRAVRSTPAGLPPLLPPAEVAAASRAPLLATIRRGEGDLNRWRVLAVPVGGRVLVVARSLGEREETLRRLFRELMIAGPLGLLFATLGGYLLAAAALRPVESMRRRAGAIGAATPGARLPVPASRDELRRLAETLNEMLGRLEGALAHERKFVADASHELRTPLAALRTEVDVALARERTKEELEEALRSVSEETERLIRLAEDLLLIARADQGHLPIRREPLSASGLLGETAARFAARARVRGREIEIAAGPDAIVDVDRLRIEQALGNLIENALAHGRGTIRLEVRSAAELVELHVQDEGRGFAPEFVSRAFDRFSVPDDSRSTGGSGLGLAIVELVAHAHGGSVGIANGPGDGADVWISLARSEFAAPAGERLPAAV